MILDNIDATLKSNPSNESLTKNWNMIVEEFNNPNKEFDEKKINVLNNFLSHFTIRL